MALHTAELRNFHCALCDKSFRTQWELKRHRNHHEPTKFVCEFCDSIFSGRDKLLRHVKTVHVSSRVFSCALCGMTFSRTDNLSRHVRKQHTMQDEEMGDLQPQISEEQQAVPEHQPTPAEREKVLRTRKAKKRGHSSRTDHTRDATPQLIRRSQRGSVRKSATARVDTPTSPDQASGCDDGYPCLLCDEYLPSESALSSHTPFCPNAHKTSHCERRKERVSTGRKRARQHSSCGAAVSEAAETGGGTARDQRPKDTRMKSADRHKGRAAKFTEAARKTRASFQSRASSTATGEENPSELQGNVAQSLSSVLSSGAAPSVSGSVHLPDTDASGMEDEEIAKINLRRPKVSRALWAQEADESDSGQEEPADEHQIYSKSDPEQCHSVSSSTELVLVAERTSRERLIPGERVIGVAVVEPTASHKDETDANVIPAPSPSHARGTRTRPPSSGDPPVCNIAQAGPESPLSSDVEVDWNQVDCVPGTPKAAVTKKRGRRSKSVPRKLRRRSPVEKQLVAEKVSSSDGPVGNATRTSGRGDSYARSVKQSRTAPTVPSVERAPTERGRVECARCHGRFKSLIAWELHTCGQTAEGGSKTEMMFECFCGSSFYSKDELTTHCFAYHVPKAPFTCDKCKGNFTRQKDLASHRCQPENTRSCAILTETSGERTKASSRGPTSDNLDDHEPEEQVPRVAVEEPPPENEYSSRRTSAIENTAATFKCGDCGQVYAGDATKHLCQRPGYWCSKCKQTFFRTNMLLEHPCSLRKYECGGCWTVLTTGEELRNHECSGWAARRADEAQQQEPEPLNPETPEIHPIISVPGFQPVKQEVFEIKTEENSDCSEMPNPSDPELQCDPCGEERVAADEVNSSDSCAVPLPPDPTRQNEISTTHQDSFPQGEQLCRKDDSPLDSFPDVILRAPGEENSPRKESPPVASDSDGGSADDASPDVESEDELSGFTPPDPSCGTPRDADHQGLDTRRVETTVNEQRPVAGATLERPCSATPRVVSDSEQVATLL